MIAVQVIKDLHAGVMQTLDTSNGGNRQFASGNLGHVNHIRRPTNGIQIKEDTFATIRVIGPDSSHQYLVDAGAKELHFPQRPGTEIRGRSSTPIYSNFLIQSVTEERAEKSQVLETFGEAYIFLFGERARVLNIQGVLINTFDFNWEAEWWHNYENYLRGTKCVENDVRVYLSYDDTLVGGYILGANAQKSSQERNWINFNFQLFVSSYTNFSGIGDPRAYPVEDLKVGEDGTLIPFSKEELDPYRVSIQDPESGNPLPGYRPKSLADALEDDARTYGLAKNVWKGAIDAVVGVLDSVTGTPILVPKGAVSSPPGSLPVDSKILEKGGVIKFPVFSDNDWEYVGRGSHYGSTVGKNGLIRYRADTPPSEMEGMHGLLASNEAGLQVAAKSIDLALSVIPTGPELDIGGTSVALNMATGGALSRVQSVKAQVIE